MPPMAPQDSLSPGGRGTMTLPDCSDESVRHDVEREIELFTSETNRGEAAESKQLKLGSQQVNKGHYIRSYNNGKT